MSVPEEDILVEIPDNDLPELAALYLKYQRDLPFVHSTIINGINWKKKSNEQLISFYSPNNCWREDGTFFCFVKLSTNDVIISSLQENNGNIYKALKQSKKLDYNKRLLFFCIHEKITPILKKVEKEKEVNESFDIPCHMFTISIDEALHFETNCPDEIYIKNLDKCHAPIVDSVYPHKNPGSQRSMEILIEMNKSFGIFLKSNNKLVAWVLQTAIGQLGILQTLPECKRKGYASLLIKHASKELAKDGIQPFGTVLVQNEAATKIFEKSKFRNIGIANYIGFGFI